MRFASLFCGIGGFDLGFERAGMSSVLQVELDAKASAVLAHHWPNVARQGDVTRVRSLPPVDLVCGGFPCQDLSVAGNRAGLAGKRSGLFYEAARLIEGARPEWVVLENVLGLLSSNHGRDMGAVLGTLDDLGYGFAYRVLNAQFFGVPHRRRRVFIVGCLGDWDGPREVLFEPESVCGHSPARRESGQEFAGSPGGGSESRGTDRMTFIPMAVSENQRAEVLLTPYARSLTVGGGKPGQGFPAALTWSGVRRLTPLECERLQGFPDDWTAGQSDTARYRQIGNAVAVPVSEWIGRRIVGGTL